MFWITEILSNVAIFIFRTMVISNESVSIVLKLRDEKKSYMIISKILGITKSYVQYTQNYGTHCISHRKLKVIKKKNGPSKKIGKTALLSLKKTFSKMKIAC